MTTFTWTHQGKPVKNELSLDTFHNGSNRKLTNVRKQKTPLGSLDIASQPILLLCYDVETTGLDHMKNAVTQISIQCIVRQYNAETKSYNYECVDTITSFVHTTQTITPFITQLTCITQDDVENAPFFSHIAKKLNDCIDICCQTHNILHCFWVAHNGFRFDHLFLAKYIQENTPQEEFWLRSVIGKRRFWCLDTCEMARRFPYAFFKDGKKPENYKLQTLYTFFTQHSETQFTDTPTLQFHRADEDVSAMVYILEQMDKQKTDMLMSVVSYDTYFRDAVCPEKMVNKINFKTLQGVHEKIIHWTAQQEKVLNAPFDEHICIIAGAGCAKTTTLLGRILCLLRNGVQPHKITLVTFSKDATEDMASRLTQWVGTEVPIRVGTFDALSRKYLKDNDTEAFEACQDVGAYKQQFLSFLEHSQSPQRQDVLQSIDYLFVDEYQDINATYHEIISRFAKHGTIITGVGDDAQNIYSWNGSDMQYILEFGDSFHDEDGMSSLPRRNVQTYYLTHNFRSTPEILDIANQCIARNTCQLPKTILSTFDSINKNESVDVYAHHNWQQEVDAILPIIIDYRQCGKSVAILCRNCTRNGPLYFYETELTKRNIKHSLLERYRDHRNHAEQGAVTLCTIHKSKGLEWDLVVVIGCNDNHFPIIDSTVLQQGEFAIERVVSEERRLFYVATTRAKVKLVYTFSMERKSIQNTRNNCLTRFLTELPRTLFKWHNVHTSMLQPTYLTNHNISTTQRILSLKKMLDTVHDHHWKALCDYVNTRVNLKALCTHTKVHSTIELPVWIQQQHLYEDIERWMEHVFVRMHLPEVTSSYELPLMDNIRQYVCVSRKEFLLYKKYKNLFQDFLEDSVMEVEVEHEDMLAFHKLFEKCKTASQHYRTQLSHLHVSTNTNVPRDIKQRLSLAYTQWKDTSRDWQSLLWESFELSWCEAIENGRMRCVHQQLEHGKSNIATLQPFVDAMSNTFIREPTVDTPCIESQYITPSRIHMHSTFGLENISETIPLILESQLTQDSVQYTMFSISLADKKLTNTNDILEYVLKNYVINGGMSSKSCLPKNISMTNIQCYYPHLGLLQTIHLDQLGVSCGDLWTVWKNILKGESPIEVQSVNTSRKCMVIETEKWEDCCID